MPKVDHNKKERERKPDTLYIVYCSKSSYCCSDASTCDAAVVKCLCQHRAWLQTSESLPRSRFLSSIPVGFVFIDGCFSGRKNNKANQNFGGRIKNCGVALLCHNQNNKDREMARKMVSSMDAIHAPTQVILNQPSGMTTRTCDIIWDETNPIPNRKQQTKLNDSLMSQPWANINKRYKTETHYATFLYICVTELLNTGECSRM